MTKYSRGGPLGASDKLIRTDSWVATEEPVVQYFDTTKAKEWIKEKIGSEDKVETEVVDIRVNHLRKEINNFGTTPTTCRSNNLLLDEASNLPSKLKTVNNEEPDEESKPSKNIQVICLND